MQFNCGNLHQNPVPLHSISTNFSSVTLLGKQDVADYLVA